MYMHVVQLFTQPMCVIGRRLTGPGSTRDDSLRYEAGAAKEDCFGATTPSPCRRRR